MLCGPHAVALVLVGIGIFMVAYSYLSREHLRRISMNRRQFLKAAAASAVVPAILRVRGASTASGEMQYRTLGRTGEKVSIVGLGGAHIALPGVSDG